MESSGVERRRHPRIKCDIPVKVRRVETTISPTAFDNRQEFMTKALNASQGGLFIESPQPLNEKELFRLSISLPGPDMRVTAFAEVVWSDPQGGGFHFLAIHEEQEGFLKDYILSCHGSRI